ncbi:hypothetical protein ACFVR1_18535 [Psychrobacillus sp. NPDC058041]|uniref:hypothetical protein n=1 Tax=Psychrobacillus sp. NPDC058041 TaxID=3346310 RepID=UPI0036DBA14A
MEDLNKLQEELKKLPKYSLENEQKEKVLYSLRSNQNSPKKTFFLTPIFTIVGICLVLLFLFLTNEYNNKLSAQTGTVFPLPDRVQEVVGVKGKIGILVPKEQFIAEDRRRGSKIMLYFWGDPNNLVGRNYLVEAVNKKGEKIELSRGILSAGLYSEDAHTLTSFVPFPNEGEWQLSFLVEDELVEAFTINVLPPFPKTEHYTLSDSPKEIPVGEEYELYIESTIGEKEQIEVQLLDDKGNIKQETIFQEEGFNIDASNSQEIYFYKGKITLKKHGTWKLIIDGEQTGLFKN